MTADLVHLPISKAKLPASYEQARAALAACAQIDECAEWAKKAEAIASYARQSEDDSLFQMATRIKARAIRRCGELLKEIEASKGGRPSSEAKRQADLAAHARELMETRGGASPGFSRAQAAREAGLSVDQRKQALRVANLEPSVFEAAIEREKPLTVTELAEMGTVKQEPPIHGREPIAFQASTKIQAALKSFAALASDITPAVVVRGALPHEFKTMADNCAAVSNWIAALQSELEKGR